jgi:ATP-dependent protease ClpP protease subunit
MPVITITGAITAAVAASVERISRSSPGEALSVLIDSPGGDIGPCRTAASAIRGHRGLTVGRTYHRCDSGALAVLAACRVRIGTTRSSFTLHEGAISQFELAGRLTAAHLRSRAQMLATSDRDFRAMMATDIGACVLELEDLESKNAILGGRQALLIGLLTKLVDDPESTQLAAARRADRMAARTPTTFTYNEMRAMLQCGPGGRPIALPRHRLRQMLRTAP